jgi:hypothetical protein
VKAFLGACLAAILLAAISWIVLNAGAGGPSIYDALYARRRLGRAKLKTSPRSIL